MVKKDNFYFYLFLSVEFVINKKPTTTPVPTTTVKTTAKATTIKKTIIRKPILIIKPPMPTRPTRRRPPVSATRAARKTTSKTTSSAVEATMKTTVQMGTASPATTASTGRPTGAPVYHTSSADFPNSAPSTSTFVRGEGASVHTGSLAFCTLFLLYTITL